MNYKFIFKTLGYILLIEALLLLLPLLTAIYYKENPMPFIYTIIIVSLVGFILTRIKNKNKPYYKKEGLFITTLSWVILSIFGALPFIFSKTIPNFFDAFFETVSGFTTTGASILKNVEALPNGILFWRSFTHWIGGMGILVFVIALLPMSNDNSMHMIASEMPGPFPGKLSPKLSTTAKWLYGIYSALTIIEIIFLLIGGMPLFDSILTSFGTAGTGGFGIKNTSIAFYNSAYIEYVVGIFMILFGINFNVFFFILVKKFKQAFKCEEMKTYFIIVIIATILITLNILSISSNIGEAFRLAFFQVSSIITTTGYSTTDFNLWPQFSKIIIFILMIIGACGGSTGGGLKVSRVAIAAKKIWYNIKSLVHPNSIKVIKYENKKIEDSVISDIGYYILLYFVIMIFVILIVSFDNLDFESTVTSVASCLGNIGPGLGIVGPSSNYSMLSHLSKFALSITMLLGRLELYPLLLFLSPSIYKKGK